MNRRPLNSLALSKAITSCVNFKTAAGPSKRPVDLYQRILEQGVDFIEGQETQPVASKRETIEYFVQNYRSQIFTWMTLGKLFVGYQSQPDPTHICS
jgi:hypothetical protein